MVSVVGVHSGSESCHGPFALLYLHRGSHSQGDFFSAKLCWPGEWGDAGTMLPIFINVASWAFMLHWVAGAPCCTLELFQSYLHPLMIVDLFFLVGGGGRVGAS